MNTTVLSFLFNTCIGSATAFVSLYFHCPRGVLRYAPKIKDQLDTSNFDAYPEDAYIPPYTGRQDVFEGF